MARATKGKAADAAKAEDKQPEETVPAAVDATEETLEAGTQTDTQSAAADDSPADTGEVPAAETAAEESPGAPDTARDERADTDTDTETVEAGDSERDGAMDDGAPALASESGDDRIEEADHAAPSVPTVVRETVVERKGGFVPMVLGGAVAAVLGFGAASFTDLRLPFLPEPAADPMIAQTQAAVSEQQDRLAALEAQMGEAQAALGGIDLQSVTTALAAAEDNIAQTRDALAALEDQIAGFESRVTAIEKQPLAEAVSPEAIAAYERELETLRGAIQEQRDAVEAQRAEIERMAQDAVAAEQNAEAQAQLAEIRSALAEVTALVQEGRPFAEPLSVVKAGGVEVPEALAAQDQDGVPTLAALAAEFPDAARDALRVARTSATPDGDGGGFATFLQNQLGARSVQPRDGDDPDAVLSRAEAAVKSGDLEAALAEIAKLPEEAQAVMADWTAKAEARRSALAAAGDLVRQINQE